MYAIVKTITTPLVAERVCLYDVYPSVEDANWALLGLYNTFFKGERAVATNWGVAVAQSRVAVNGAHKTTEWGEREFTYECLSFRVVDEKELHLIEEDYKTRLLV